MPQDATRRRQPSLSSRANRPQCLCSQPSWAISPAHPRPDPASPTKPAELSALGPGAESTGSVSCHLAFQHLPHMLKQGIQRGQPTVLPGWLDRVTKASQNFLDSKGQGEWADGTSCPEPPAEGAPGHRCASVSPRLDGDTYGEITGT